MQVDIVNTLLVYASESMSPTWVKVLAVACRAYVKSGNTIQYNKIQYALLDYCSQQVDYI